MCEVVGGVREEVEVSGDKLFTAQKSPCSPCKVVSQTVYNTKGTRAHTHRELI